MISIKYYFKTVDRQEFLKRWFRVGTRSVLVNYASYVYKPVIPALGRLRQEGKEF